MALVPIRVDRTSKPPIGTPLRSDGHWSVDGLVTTWALNEGYGVKCFDAKGIPSAKQTGTKWTPEGLYSTGGTPAGIVVSTPVPASNPVTLFAVVNMSAFASDRQNIASFGPYTLYIAPTTGTLIFEVTTSNSHPAAISNVLSDTIMSCAGTYTGPGGTHGVYANGQSVKSSQVIGSGTVSALSTSNIGSNNANPYAYAFKGVISQVSLYSLVLSPEQIASLSANPWQIYEPETVWIEVGGGGAAETRNLIAAITGQSTTPSIQAATLRTLLAAVSGGSVTSTIQATLARALLASVIGSSLTPGIAATLSGLISLVASIPAQSLASTAQATINRALTAAISGQSGTPSISALIHGVISLVASVSGQSSTPSVAVTTARLLLAAINGGSSTAASRASADRSLAAIVSGQSNTPGVAAMLANMVSLAAGISAHSTTPAALATLQRDMMAAIHAATSTGIISASTSRAMSAVIEGQSLAPDNIMATLAGLGLVLDTSIESRTIILTLRSLTKKYTIHSI